MGYFDCEAAVQAAEQTWASTPDVRREFNGDKAAFIAYRVAAAQGRARACTGKVQTLATVDDATGRKQWRDDKSSKPVSGTITQGGRK